MPWRVEPSRDLVLLEASHRFPCLLNAGERIVGDHAGPRSLEGANHRVEAAFGEVVDAASG